MTLTEGIHACPADVHHADPCPEPSLSFSVGKIFLDKSPRHVWMAHPRLNPAFERTEQTNFDIGRATHSLLLENDESKLVVIEADSWRTNAAKAERDAAYADGKTPLLQKDADRVFAMRDAAIRQLERSEEGQSFLGAGLVERTIIWREGDAWCRARPDKIVGNVIWDLKTTTDASPDAWARQLYNLHYDVQAIWYMRGYATAKWDMPDRLKQPILFRFIVQETTPPYALMIAALPPAAIEMAEAKAKWMWQQWDWCMKHNRWPGYPRETCYIDPPPWELNKYEERKARDEIAREQNVDLLQTMIDWQAPHEGGKE
jgi:hypothetical protein